MYFTFYIVFLQEQQNQSFLSLSLYYLAVQLLSCIWLSATPWTAACQASLSFTISWSLLKLMFIESVLSSDHLILCLPLLLTPSIFPSIKVFSNELAVHSRWPKCWSFSFSISPSNEYSGLISFRIDWFDLLAVQGTLQSLLRHHSSMTSILCMLEYETGWARQCTSKVFREWYFKKKLWSGVKKSMSLRELKKLCAPPPPFTCKSSGIKKLYFQKKLKFISFKCCNGCFILFVTICLYLFYIRNVNLIGL